jgi:hypothetical protein
VSRSEKGRGKLGPRGEKEPPPGPADCPTGGTSKSGSTEKYRAAEKKLVQAQLSFVDVVEMWVEQKWVQQMKSVRLAPDAEWQDLA